MNSDQTKSVFSNQQLNSKYKLQVCINHKLYLKPFVQFVILICLICLCLKIKKSTFRCQEGKDKQRYKNINKLSCQRKTFIEVGKNRCSFNRHKTYQPNIWRVKIKSTQGNLINVCYHIFQLIKQKERVFKNQQYEQNWMDQQSRTYDSLSVTLFKKGCIKEKDIYFFKFGHLDMNNLHCQFN